MDEQVNYQDIRDRNGRHRSIKDVCYVIQIIYAPENVNSNKGKISSKDEKREWYVNIRTAVNAHKVFKDLIQQIREQMPDQLYLDTALERMISNMDMATLQAKDEQDK